MTNYLVVTVLINSILVLAQEYEPRKILGTWNVLAVVHTLPKDTPTGERCTRFRYEHLIDNVYRLTRDRIVRSGENERTISMMTIIGSKIVISPSSGVQSSVQTILDYDDELELVLFSYATHSYFLLSRDLALSSRLLKKYSGYKELKWNLTPILQTRCDERPAF